MKVKLVARLPCWGVIASFAGLVTLVAVVLDDPDAPEPTLEPQPPSASTDPPATSPDTSAEANAWVLMTP